MEQGSPVSSSFSLTADKPMLTHLVGDGETRQIGLLVGDRPYSNCITTRTGVSLIE